jgi:hypothetical protein
MAIRRDTMATGHLDREDLRLLWLGRDPNFALEALRAESRGQLWVQHLDCDRSIVPKVLGEVHRRHATAAELTVE